MYRGGCCAECCCCWCRPGMQTSTAASPALSLLPSADAPQAGRQPTQAESAIGGVIWSPHKNPTRLPVGHGSSKLRGCHRAHQTLIPPPCCCGKTAAHQSSWASSRTEGWSPSWEPPAQGNTPAAADVSIPVCCTVPRAASHPPVLLPGPCGPHLLRGEGRGSDLLLGSLRGHQTCGVSVLLVLVAAGVPSSSPPLCPGAGVCRWAVLLTILTALGSNRRQERTETGA